MSFLGTGFGSFRGQFSPLFRYLLSEWTQREEVRALETLGALIRAAIAKKRAAIGHYGYRDLAADSGVSFGYARKVAVDIQTPSRDVVVALARALEPYLSLDEALIAAGYVPPGVSASRLQRFIAALRDGVRRDDELIDQILEEERRRADGESEPE